MAITVGKGATVPFNIANTLGVDFTNTYPSYAVPGSSATQTNLYYPENSNPNFSLGTHVFGGSNSEYLLCVVGTAGSINQYDAVFIDNNYNVIQTSSASAAAAAQLVGFNQGGGYAASQSSVTVNFCWIAIRGAVTVNTNAATGAATKLYLGTAPGTLGSGSAGTTVLLQGIGNIASVTAATTMAIIAADFPVVNIGG